MSYVGGKETELRGFSYAGFGGIYSDLASSITDTAGRAAMSALQQKSADEILALKNSGWYSGILAEVLEGAEAPIEIAKRASALVDSTSLDAASKAAYKLFYGQTRAGFSLADQVAKIPGAAEAVGLVGSGFDVYTAAQTFWDPKGKIDSGGAADGLNLVRQVASSARRLASIIGGPTGDTIGQIVDWTGVAVGCATTISAGSAAGPYGTVAGAVACAASVMIKVFKDFFSSPATPDRHTTPRAIFAPSEDQTGVISADAVRLAAVLKYHYKIPSYEYLFNVLESVVVESKPYKNKFGRWGRGITPKDRPPVPSAGGGSNFPGYSPGDVILLLGYTTGLNIDQLGELWFPLVQAFGGKKRAIDLAFWGDVDPIAAKKTLDWANAHNSYEVGVGWFANGRLPWGLSYTGYWPIGKARGSTTPTRLAFSRYLELVNFFAAVTMQDVQEVPLDLGPWKKAYPVPLFRHGGNYTPKYTGIELPDADEADITEGVSYGDQIATLRLGAARLCSAFSYLHMMYYWGRPDDPIAYLRGGIDLIEELPDLGTADPAAVLRKPVNPRAKNGVIPSPQDLHKAINNDTVQLKELFKQARQQAIADQMGMVTAGTMLEINPLALKSPLELYLEMQKKHPGIDFTQMFADKKPAAVGSGALVVGAAALLALTLLRR